MREMEFEKKIQKGAYLKELTGVSYAWHAAV